MKTSSKPLLWIFSILVWGMATAHADNSVSQGTATAASLGILSAPTVASQCMACHGPSGMSQNPVWPNLAGQQKDYLALQLKNFRSGARQNGMMNVIVQDLNDQDIETLADYFSKLNPFN